MDMSWVSWPQKVSQMASNLNQNGFRALDLACGLVDSRVGDVEEM